MKEPHTSEEISTSSRNQNLRKNFEELSRQVKKNSERFYLGKPRMVERNEDTRKAMYTEMQQLIHDHSGALIPVYNAFIDAVSTDVHGFESSPSQSLMDQLIHEMTWFG